MDKMTIAVIVVLVIVVGIFISTQIGGGGEAVNTVVQVGGGGCGR